MMADRLLVPEDSPLRRPPPELSRRQVLFLDGIRYAAEMADVAYQRLFDGLKQLADSRPVPSTRDIARVMLDAWSIVDAVHRFVDLVEGLPGLKHGPWLRLLRDRCGDLLALRDDVQHQNERAVVVPGRPNQLWGYLSWAEVDESGQHTGGWWMASAGSEYVGDQWLFIGPNTVAATVPAGRIRLNAFGRSVYLGQCVEAAAEVVQRIGDQLKAGAVRTVGSPATDRSGADSVVSGVVEVLYGSSHAQTGASGDSGP